MRAKLPNNWGHYNPNRKLPTRAQGDTINPRPTGIRSKGSIDLYSVIHRQVSMGQPVVRRLLERLHLALKHEGTTYSLCKGDLVLYTSTDLHYAKAQRQVLNFLLQDYIPDLLATGTVPPPPPEDPEKAWRRRVRANQKAKRLYKRSRGSGTGRGPKPIRRCRRAAPRAPLADGGERFYVASRARG